MVLEFGLLKSGLFNESELSGEGLGGDPQQTIVGSPGMVLLTTKDLAGLSTVTLTLANYPLYNAYKVVYEVRPGSVNQYVTLRFNGLTSATYWHKVLSTNTISTSSGNTSITLAAVDTTALWPIFGEFSFSVGTASKGICMIHNASSINPIVTFSMCGGNNASVNALSFTFYMSAGSFTTGLLSLYGLKR